MTIKEDFAAALPDIEKMVERDEKTRKVFATIALRGLDRATEVAMLKELRAVCQAEEKRAFGLSYECETDDIHKITRIMAHFEKYGLTIDRVREGETHVFVARKWMGFRRTLSTGQVQICRRGRILTYANKKDLLADGPLHESETFEHFEKVKGLA